MTQAAITYDGIAHARAGKTRELAELVRRELAQGRSVAVVNHSGTYSGRAWLDAYDKAIPIAAGDYLRWTLHGCGGGEMWAEGVARDVHANGRVMAMTVERTSNWPVAERCVRAVQLICPEIGDPSDKEWSSIKRVPRPVDAPIGVGDYVRYDGQQCDENNRITGRINQWLEGDVTSFLNDNAVIRVARHSDGARFASEVYIPPVCLRRVAPDLGVSMASDFKIGDRISWRPCAESSWGGCVIDGMVDSIDTSGNVTAMPVTAVTCETPPVQRAPHLGERIGVSHKPGTVVRLSGADDHKVGDYVRWDNPRAACWIEGELTSIKQRSDTYAVATILIHGAGQGWRIGSETTVGVGTPPGDRTPPATLRRIARPDAAEFVAPTTIEGLTHVECYQRWRENRIAVECGAAPSHAMTDAQIAAAKQIWSDEWGLARSVALRCAIAESDAADRARQVSVVTIDEELETANAPMADS